MTKNITYEQLNSKWRTAMKMLLGAEVGELSEFGDWLIENVEMRGEAPSCISGKRVHYSSGEYARGARGILFDEIDFGAKPLPIDNASLDFGSLLSEFAARACYAGNVVLGNSKFVEGSSSIIDSFYVLDSNMVSESKHVAYSSVVKNSEAIFGANLEDYSQFLVRGFDTYKNMRALEAWSTYLSSDCYYTLRCEDCHDCMFCFNLRGRRNCIGNMQLPREKYLATKARLLAEMREMLAMKKRLPSLLEMVKKSVSACTQEEREAVARAGNGGWQGDRRPMEEAFGKTTVIVLGKRLSGMDGYGKWLSHHVKMCTDEKSAFSGKKTVCGEFFPFTAFPKERLLTLAEGLAAGEMLSLSEQEAEGLSFGNAYETIGKIAYFPSRIMLGENFNIMRAMMGYKAQHCYSGGIFSNTKCSGFSHFARNSDYMWGCTFSYNCNFCINTFNSNKVCRSFEIDSCFNCSGSYFLHNCENCHGCMFCWNAKNLRYAVLNVEVGKERFDELKRKVLGEIVDRLESKGKLDVDIYNAASGGAE